MRISIIWTIITAVASLLTGFLWDVTWGCLITIVSFFLYSLWNVFVLWRAYTCVNNACNSDDKNTALDNTKLSSLFDSYRETITIKAGELTKSNTPSSELFSLFRIARCFGLYVRFLDSASGTLVGLGLLGTFLGLTLGIHDFDTTNAANIQSSIQTLLDGMGTAFSTSLLGM